MDGIYGQALAKRYDWRPVAAAVRRWQADQGRGTIELRIGTVDTEFGTVHHAPRASTLVVRASFGLKSNFFVLLKPAVARANLPTMRRTLGADSARVASLAEVHLMTRCRPGCVPPIATLFDLSLLVDSRLADAEAVFVPSGQPGYATLIRMRDLLRAENARVVPAA
ncbi:MAG: YbaK/EbsC family protein [Gemmatimonadota bacterium]|nr:YbaK/EbsC family protein [Gemmatimonadota bacterium]